MLRIKLIKSTVGHNLRNRRTIQALGLRKPHQVVEHDDTPSIRGMIQHVRALLQVEELPGDPAPKVAKTKAKETVAEVVVKRVPAKKTTAAAKPAETEEKPKRAKKAKAEEN